MIDPDVAGDEVWRIIPSLPEYLASSHGRVMCIPHFSDKSRGLSRQYGGQPHRGIWNGSCGRFLLCLKGKTYKVHRLVCEAFNGPPPAGTEVCMHLNENAANNRPKNLAWGTHKENFSAPGIRAWRRAFHAARRESRLGEAGA